VSCYGRSTEDAIAAFRRGRQRNSDATQRMCKLIAAAASATSVPPAVTNAQAAEAGKQAATVAKSSDEAAPADITQEAGSPAIRASGR
jgi:hypothetical protein